MSRPMPGALLAAATAAISGVSVFVNSYGVHAFHRAAAYTTGKNLVAGVVLAVVFSLHRRPRQGHSADMTIGRFVALGYVSAVGGGAAFILFFEGLARTPAVPAAFLHDTLVVWVALMAAPLLGERLIGWNLVAIAFLVAGQALSGGGIGALAANRGAGLVLAATLLWSVEVILAKRLLAGMPAGDLAVVRMAGGSAVLVAYLAITGHLHQLVGMNWTQARWVLLTGVLLAAYVATWMSALSRARALDVTSILVMSVIITAALDAAAGHGVAVSAWAGCALIGLGAAAVVRAWPRRVPVLE